MTTVLQFSGRFVLCAVIASAFVTRCPVIFGQTTDAPPAAVLTDAEKRLQWLNARMPPKPAAAAKPKIGFRSNPKAISTRPIEGQSAETRTAQTPAAETRTAEMQPPKSSATEPAGSKARTSETRTAKATPAPATKATPATAVAEGSTAKKAATEDRLAKSTPSPKGTLAPIALSPSTPAAKSPPSPAITNSPAKKKSSADERLAKATPAPKSTPALVAQTTPAPVAKPTPAVAEASSTKKRATENQVAKTTPAPKSTPTALAKTSVPAKSTPAPLAKLSTPAPVVSTTKSRVTEPTPTAAAKLALTPAISAIPSAPAPAPGKTTRTEAPSSPTTKSRYPWKSGIVTTVFWIGERPTANNLTPNRASSWDANWAGNYGGFDSPDPSARRNFIPVSFTPRQNPFYVALPYNDVTRGTTKPEARRVIPWFREAFEREGQSVCRDRWVAIRSRSGRVAYAQWSDCGPFRTDHWEYVFGNERPKPNLNKGAGLDVSPAVRDYLGLDSTDVTDWKFVDAREVPGGPWARYGSNNTLVMKESSPTKVASKPSPKVATRKVDYSSRTRSRDL